MNEFNFSSLEVIEIPVVGPDNKPYVLREASGDVVAKFNNARGRCVEFQEKGIHKMHGGGDLEAFLVSLCLFHAARDSNNEEVDMDHPELWTADTKKPLTAMTIRSWPGKVVKVLFDKAKEISEIDEPEDLKALIEQRDKLDKQIKGLEEDQAKNGLVSIPIGCD